MDQTLINMIVAISVAFSTIMITLIVKSITAYFNKALVNARRVATKDDFVSFQQTVREEMATEFIKQDSKMVNTITMLFDKKVQEIAGIGTKISDLDTLVNKLKAEREKFEKAETRISELEEKYQTLEKKFQRFVFGATDSDDTISRRKS